MARLARRACARARALRAEVVFFQAEDGIRDRDVTGVQTCALPISDVRARIAAAGLGIAERVATAWDSARTFRGSEERRVGKEHRSRGPAGPRKKTDPEDPRGFSRPGPALDPPLRSAGMGRCHRRGGGAPRAAAGWHVWREGRVRVRVHCVRRLFFFKQKTAYEIVM